MKTIFFTLCIFFSTLVFSQNITKEIISLNRTDTAFIKRFDENNNLIFHKIFPQYGVSQILVYEFKENKLIRYIWSHSNIGFVVEEYEYLDNQIITKEYSQKESVKIPNLMTLYTAKDLKQSKQYILIHIETNGFTESISLLEKNHVIKKFVMNSTKDTTQVIDFKYANGNLIEKQDNYYGKNGFNKLAYSYDENGNELSWTKIFSPNDTSYVFESVYKNGKLIKQIGYDKGNILSSTENYYYKKGNLKSKKKFDKNQNLKIESQFNYDKNGILILEEKTNLYMGTREKIYYYYY